MMEMDEMNEFGHELSGAARIPSLLYESFEEAHT